MVTLEQIRLLETKVSRAIEIVNQITDENTFLKGKLESYQKRIDELEVLIQRFKEDQGRIEEGIVSALNRLNQFEESIEGSLAPVKSDESLEKPTLGGSPAVEAAAPAETEADDGNTAGDSPVYAPAEEEADETVIFDDSEDGTGEQAEVLLEESLDESPDLSGDDEPAAELDIF